MYLHYQAIAPRQNPSQTSGTSTTDTNAATPTSDLPGVAPMPSRNPIKTKLLGWQIMLIVVGGLIFIGLLCTLALLVRSRINRKRAKSVTNLPLAGTGGVGGTPGTGGVFDLHNFVSDYQAQTQTQSQTQGQTHTPTRPKRESVLMEARVKIRRLVKPRRNSSRGGFASILGIGGGKANDDDIKEDQKVINSWSPNGVTKKKSLVLHENHNGSGLTSLAREQQEREGRYHQQVHQPSNQQFQYHHNHNHHNHHHDNNTGRDDDDWMVRSDSVAHTIRGSYDDDGQINNAEDGYVDSPPTTGIGHEVIALESRLGSGLGSGSGSGFSFRFGHDRRKPG